MLYHDGKPQKVLTFKRMLKSIENGEIDVPSIQEEDIADKGKSDFLTKSLVVVQTTWFVAQCTARWRLSLPLAELEVLTLAFAALNGIIYVIWWNKPQGVQVPIKLPLGNARESLPVCQGTSSAPLCNTSGPELTQSAPDSIINPGTSTVEVTSEAEAMLAYKPHEEVYASRASGGEELYDKESCHEFLKCCDKLGEAFQSIRNRQEIGSSRFRIVFISILLPIIFLKRFASLLVDLPFNPRDRRHANATVGRIRVPMSHSEYKDRTLTTPLLSAVIGSVFGAFHLTLWSSPSFPTPLEHQWWRWCALLITVSPAFAAILLLASYFAPSTVVNHFNDTLFNKYPSALQRMNNAEMNIPGQLRCHCAF